MYDLDIKMWLVKDGRFIMSGGRARLLGRIRETRSISKAAKEMEMAYRHAWGILRRIAENASSKGNNGKVSRNSTVRWMTSSTQPPK